MSYQKEREQFIHLMTREGLTLYTTRLLLREATGLNRRAELACSSEAADRDRVPCPASQSPQRPCLCDLGPNGEHSSITRITLQDFRAEQRVKNALPAGWALITAGDPRGYVLRVIPPSYAARNNDGRDPSNYDSIGVPNGPSGLKW